MLSIGEKIAGVRVTRELTLDMVSQKTGINVFALYNYEHDIEKIPCDDMQKIAKALDTTVNYFADGFKGIRADRSELFGCLVDVVEDWLAEKGITAKDIPNPEREGNEMDLDGSNEAIIYGSDYDRLCNGFSAVLEMDEDGVAVDGVLTKTELELLSNCILGQISAVNSIPSFFDDKLLAAQADLAHRLADLNSKICRMMPEDEE